MAEYADAEFLNEAVDEVLAAHPYRTAEDDLGFLIGQVMRAVQGRGSPAYVQERIRKRLAWTKADAE